MVRPSNAERVIRTPEDLQKLTNEVESQSSIDSGVVCNGPKHRYATRANTRKISESLRVISRMDRPDVDIKENIASLAKRRRIELPDRALKNRQPSKKKKNQSQKISSKLTIRAQQCRSKPEESTADEEMELSQCDPNSNWIERLMWHQPRHDIGLWVQCCRESCGKWRFNEQFHDPIDVPEIWYCDMHPDPSVASCDYPEENILPAEAENFIENEYNAGSIVWARLDGYPWWPAMIDDCPLTFSFFKLPKNSKVPNKYNVTYFEEGKVRGSWIPVKDLRPFKHNPKEVFLKRKKMKFRGKQYKEEIAKACEMAEEAQLLSISERLAKFSLIGRWESLEAADKTEESREGRDETARPSRLTREFSAMRVSSSNLATFRKLSAEGRAEPPQSPESVRIERILSCPFAADEDEPLMQQDSVLETDESSELLEEISDEASTSSIPVEAPRRRAYVEVPRRPAYQFRPFDRPFNYHRAFSAAELEQEMLPIRNDDHLYTFQDILEMCTRYTGAGDS